MGDRGLVLAFSFKFLQLMSILVLSRSLGLVQLVRLASLLVRILREKKGFVRRGRRREERVLFSPR